MKMMNTVWNGTLSDETRPRWSRTCPGCDLVFRFTVLNVKGGVEPFLYSDTTSDFLLRDKDEVALLHNTTAGEYPGLDQLRDFYRELEDSLDECPGGGCFKIWSNVRCPHCKYEFPSNYGLQSEEVRYYETNVIWVEGAIAYRGPNMTSNRLKQVLLP